MFIQFIHANDLRPLFVVVQFFQCLGLWNSGGKKSPTPNPPIAVSYGTWRFTPESLPYHQQNELFFCQPKRRVSSLRILSISGAPTCLAPLDGACRVSAPPLGGKRRNENPRWWRDFHRDWVNTIYGIPTGLFFHPKNVWKDFFSTWPFGVSSCSTCSGDPKETIWNSTKTTDIFEFNDN